MEIFKNILNGSVPGGVGVFGQNLCWKAYYIFIWWNFSSSAKYTKNTCINNYNHTQTYTQKSNSESLASSL